MIDKFIAGLDSVIAAAIAESSRVGYFAAMYRQVTLRLQQYIAQGRFEDGERMERFTNRFGDRYFVALAAYQRGEQPSRVWELAFQATEQLGITIVQHLVLGINAHVNLDLGLAAVEVAPGSSITILEQDYNLINNILAEILDDLQTKLNAFSPWLGLLDLVGGRNDEAITNFSINKAREEAWETALLLAPQTPEQRQGAEVFIDRKAAQLGQVILEPGPLLNRAIALVRRRESDDIATIIQALNTIIVDP